MCQIVLFVSACVTLTAGRSKQIKKHFQRAAMIAELLYWVIKQLLRGLLKDCYK